MKPSPQVAVIVVSYNTKDLLLECLSSIIESTDPGQVEIVVVDNHSSDGSPAAVQHSFPQVITILNEINRGFAAACNQAIENTSAPLVLLLNSDARLTTEAFRTLCEVINRHDRCGAAGARIVNSKGVEAPSTRNFLTPFNQALELLGATQMNSKRLRRTYHPIPDDKGLDCTVDWIDGACLMLRRSALDDVGLLDERFFIYSEDEDLCFRLRNQGWSVCFTTRGTVTHHGAASSSQSKAEMLRQFYYSQLLFLIKHRGKNSARLYFQLMKAVFSLKKLMSPVADDRMRANHAGENLVALSKAWSQSFGVLNHES